MLPHIANESAITFFGRGQAWHVASDHAMFEVILNLIRGGYDDIDALAAMADVRVAISDATDGAAILTEEGLTVNGVALSQEWVDLAVATPTALRVLLVHDGDTIEVIGDEDAPDGDYVVSSIDEGDADKRIYIESDDGFFGFVSNKSVKRIVRRASETMSMIPA